MSEVEIDNCGKWKVAWAQSSNPQAAIAAFRKGEVDTLGISSYKGFSGKDISFLKELSAELTGLNFPRAGEYDLSMLQQFEKLRYLRIHDSKQNLDLQGMTSLEDLSLEWHPGYVLPNANTPLTELGLWKYKTKSKDLSELPAYPNLKTLDLVQGNLTSLAGIERLGRLRKGDFNYMTKLESVKDLAKTPVQSVMFQACKKVEDLESLAACPNLKLLVLYKFADLNSLSFLENFKSLEEFRFVITKIKDGDMTPLLKLKNVSFLKHRSYSHTPEEIKRLIGQAVVHWDQTNLRVELRGSYTDELVTLHINDEKLISKKLTAYPSGGLAMSLQIKCQHPKNTLRVEIPRLNLERQVEIDLCNGDRVKINFLNGNLEINQTK